MKKTRRLIVIALLAALAFSFVFAVSDGFTDWSAFSKVGEAVGGYFSGKKADGSSIQIQTAWRA